MIEAFWELSISQRYKDLLWPRGKWEPYGCVAWVVFRAIVGCLAWTVPFHLELHGVKCWRLRERAFEPHYPSGVPCDSSGGHLLLPEETPDLCMRTGGNTAILGQRGSVVRWTIKITRRSACCCAVPLGISTPLYYSIAHTKVELSSTQMLCLKMWSSAEN